MTKVLSSVLLLAILATIADCNVVGDKHNHSLRDKHREAFLNRRQMPEYAESNHFTPEETVTMRKARRRQREFLKILGISDNNPKAKMSLLPKPRVVDEEQVNQHLGLHLFEGDMILTKSQEEIIERINDTDARQQAFQSDFLYRWDNGVVPYVLHKSLNTESIYAIFDAMDEMQQVSYRCIVFRERRKKRDRNFIRFISDEGCWSHVGMVGGVQELSVENTDAEGYTCAVKGIVMHELFHALGRFHEQNRYDRDEYVSIHTNNVEQDYMHNFDKKPASIASTQDQEYDFDSIMHYGAYDFAIVPTTAVITSKTGDVISGQRDHLTQKDVNHIIEAYCY